MLRKKSANGALTFLEEGRKIATAGKAIALTHRRQDLEPGNLSRRRRAENLKAAKETVFATSFSNRPRGGKKKKKGVRPGRRRPGQKGNESFSS